MKKKGIRLSLSGGGANGAYQAGVILALHVSGFTFSSVSGISAGALNAAMISQKNILALRSVWVDQSAGLINIFTPARAAIRLIMGKKSLVSPSGLREIIDRNITGDPLDFIPVTVVSTDIHTGKAIYRDTHKDAIGLDEFKKWLLASASVPGLLPPVKIGQDGSFVDGGIRGSIPNPSDIAPDITIVCRSANNRHYGEDKGILGLVAMCDQIRREDVLYNEIKDLKKEYGTDVISPIIALPSPWDFSRDSLEKSFDIGYKDGLEYSNNA